MSFFIANSIDAKEIGPGANLCAEINSLPPGEELVLQPGEYQGPCTIRNSGSAHQPLVIRAKDASARPRIMYQGDRANVLNIAASYVTIRGLAFGPTRADVDAIRVRSGDFITIAECEFEGVGGIVFVANTKSGRGLIFRNNHIQSSQTTGIYIGCHDGIGCVQEDVLVEGNFIDGVDAPDPHIGYGIQIKLNSTARIRENIIMNTKGPGIMVYGATAPDKLSVIERNAVSGSRQSGAIVLGGGPAIVRNNVVSRSAEGGIRLENYGRRGLLRNIAIVHNTAFDNPGGGITLQPLIPLRDVWIGNNAVHSPGRSPAYPSSATGLLSLGNVDCSRAACFQDPYRGDFSPATGSPLIGAGIPRLSEWMSGDDFAGNPRGHPPTVGAFESQSSSIPRGLGVLPLEGGTGEGKSRIELAPQNLP
jgi:hypothetical protein